jgi:glucokinase
MPEVLCGVDIGGTKCSIALIDYQGKILDKIYTCAHVEEEEEDGMVRMVAGHVKELLQRNQVKESDIPALGVGCAGHIRFSDGVIVTTSNLEGFDNYPLRDKLQSHFGIPVILDNDANAQAVGEHKFGAGKDYEDMIFVTISTGIGAGLILNGKAYRGMSGTAGEFGHTIVEPNSELVCTCGNNGCLMACACGMALPHLFEKKLKEGMQTLIKMPPNFNISKINGQTLKKGLDQDDPVSRAVISDSAYYVGIGLYNLFQTLNPPLIVLGGGLTNWGAFYLDKIKETFYKLAGDMLVDPIEITLSHIIGDAGVIGAAALSLE